ncbi:receptor-like protein EIX2 [Abrus precatorius]|uniref:Receptor-like protein EIX2 n=1 Tax=Abrus precatorius TaxID=3816 RepID=A0A8B8LUT1_ABRPR|nr:receptor-like protein EIX2 [Abrus precatorius]
MFTGSVSSLCSLSPLYLTYLDLSSNLLTGPLPDCWEKFKSLQVLNLAKNNLSGRLPKSLGNLRQIESLHLNNKNFSGTLPAWVGHNLHQLVILRLRENKFHGSIPTSLCNLTFLQVLDLFKNNITGKIPQCLSCIIALSNLKFPRKTIFYSTSAPVGFDSGQTRLFIDEAILAWKGKNREYGKILGLMTIIDLSCNHLSGEIPNSITTLVGLAGLNLSTNNITGFIPNNIGDMQMLESLDLSFNHLYGRMPLSGKIPESTQLQSFDSSTYVGNNGLCAPPLQNQCPEDGVSPTRSTERNDKDEDEFITLGFYVSMSLGFCAGFWAVCGTLVIKSSWRHAYFRFFHNMNDWICVGLVVLRARMKKRFQAQD